MRNLSLRQICKALVLYIPKVRQLYDFSLALKTENQSIKAQLLRQNFLPAGMELSDDPEKALAHELPEDFDGQCLELERRILLVLGSKQLSKMSVDLQVRWIQQIFTQCISRLHPKSRLFAELIDELLPEIFRCQSLPMASACHLYDAMYGLYWCGAQSLMDMRGFDAQTVGLFRGYLSSHGFTSKESVEKFRKPEKEIRVGYFCHYAYEAKGNALAPVVSALAKKHAKKKDRKIFVYCVQWASQAFIDEFDGSGVTVRNYPNQLDYAQLDNLAAAIQTDKIDVVITEVASSIANYVFAKRVASCQMWLEPGYPFWSNPDVDWVLVPGKVWQPWFGISRDRHSNLRLGLPLASGGNEPTADELEEAKLKLPRGVKIFAVFTRLIKITPTYLGVVKRILTQVPNTHMIFVGTGDSRLVNSFIRDDAIRGRVTLFNENVDLNVYGRLIDVFLDTFPFIGGLACRDVACHGKPVVSLLAGEWDILLKEERIPSLLVSNVEEYFGVATRLVLDDQFYTACATDTLLLSAHKNDETEMILDVEFGISCAVKNL
jgi:hypothetical protein